MNLFSIFVPQIIAKFPSKINGEIKVVESFGKKAIYVDGAPQSGGTIVSMWEEAIEKFKVQSSKWAPYWQVQNCLVLGLGGGTIVKVLRKYYPEINITAIEIDPLMRDVARDYFGLSENSSLQMIIADAFSWVKHAKKEKFDLVIADLYIGNYNPVKARESAFLTDLARLIGRTGIVIYNSHYYQGNSREFENLMIECQKVFTKTKVIVEYK